MGIDDPGLSFCYAPVKNCGISRAGERAIEKRNDLLFPQIFLAHQMVLISEYICALLLHSKLLLHIILKAAAAAPSVKAVKRHFDKILEFLWVLYGELLGGY